MNVPAKWFQSEAEALAKYAAALKTDWLEQIQNATRSSIAEVIGAGRVAFQLPSEQLRALDVVRQNDWLGSLTSRYILDAAQQSQRELIDAFNGRLVPDATLDRYREWFESLRPSTKVAQEWAESVRALNFELEADDAADPSPSPFKVDEIAKPPQAMSFTLVQSWEGVVEEVADRDVHVRLFDKTDPNRDEERAVIDIDEIDPADLALLREGAVFYWRVGYDNSASGRRRVGFIRFRRVPARRAADVERSRRIARDAVESLADPGRRAAAG